MDVRKRARKANFSRDETQTLIEEVSRECDILLGSPEVPNGAKREIWSSIALRVNALYGHDRTLAEMKKKWKDLRAAVKHSRHRMQFDDGPNSKMEGDMMLIRQVSDILEESASKFKSGSDESTTIAITDPVGSYFPHLDAMVIAPENGASMNMLAEEESLTVSPAAENPGMPSGSEISVSVNETKSTQVNQIDLAHTNQTNSTKVKHNKSVRSKQTNSTPVKRTKFDHVNQNNSAQVGQSISIHSNHRSLPSYTDSSSNGAKSKDESRPVLVQSNDCYIESLQEHKLKLEIKWLESEIAKNDSIVELNNTKADYVRAKKAQLEM